MAKNEIKTRIIYFLMKKSVFKESMSSVNKIVQIESFQASKLYKELDRVYKLISDMILCTTHGTSV